MYWVVIWIPGRSVFVGQIPKIVVLLKHEALSLREDVLFGHPKDLYVLETGS
jgi:hypothetical protein